MDNNLVPAADKVLMDPGTREVSISHRCYSPVSFKVGVFRDKEETFKETLKPVMGGLSLKAHSATGEERNLTVIVNGEKAGTTPYSGSVPVCAKIAVADESGEHPVDVGLEQGKVTTFDYVESAQEVASLQPGESIPSNVEQPSSGLRTGLRITSGVVSALGFGAALYGIIKMKNLADQAPDNKEDYEARLEDIDNHEWFRRFGLLFGGIGLVGLGLTFVF